MPISLRTTMGALSYSKSTDTCGIKKLIMTIMVIVVQFYRNSTRLEPKPTTINNPEWDPHVSHSHILYAYVPSCYCLLISSQVVQNLSTYKISVSSHQNSSKFKSTFFWSGSRHVVKLRTGLRWLRMYSSAGLLVFVWTKLQVPFVKYIVQ